MYHVKKRASIKMSQKWSIETIQRIQQNEIEVIIETELSKPGDCFIGKIYKIDKWGLNSKNPTYSITIDTNKFLMDHVWMHYITNIKPKDKKIQKMFELCCL